MTYDEAIAIGKRVVACKGFRPMRGMLDMQGRTWDSSLLWRWHNEVDVPDLRDAATVGCVLALVREAWCDPYAHTMFESQSLQWCVWGVQPDDPFSDGNTEAEALVAALEAAP
jgi:hypothetical protein